MLLGYSHQQMAKKRYRTAWAEAVRRRREDLGLTQEQVAELAGRSFSQRTVSSIETGVVNPMNLRSDRLLGLLSALKWTLADFKKASGLDHLALPDEITADDLKSEAELLGVDHAVMPFTKRVPLLSATGGRSFYFDIPDGLWRPNTVAAIIQGDSMSPTLDPGDIALADTSLLDLRDGEMYIFEIPGDGYTIKRIYRSNGGWELHPDNRKYRPTLLPEDWSVVGEVYDAWGPKGVRWRRFSTPL